MDSVFRFTRALELTYQIESKVKSQILVIESSFLTQIATNIEHVFIVPAIKLLVQIFFLHIKVVSATLSTMVANWKVTCKQEWFMS